MKILFICSRFYPLQGGVEKHALEVALRLMKDGHEVSVLTKSAESSGTPSADFSIYKSIKIYRFQGDKKSELWRAIFNHRHLIDEADVIHCHDVFFWYLPFRFLYPTKKVFTTFHGYETVYPPRFGAKLIRRLSAFLSNGTINVGSFIQKWYGTWPDFVVYGGTGRAMKKFEKVERISKDGSEDRRSQHSRLGSVLVLGRLERDVFPQMYFELLDSLKSARVEVCGDGSLRSDFERFGVVHDWVADPTKFIQKADVVFASSYLSIVEALSYGKYVVALYDNPLKHDYLRMAPFSAYIEVSNDPKKTAQKIIKMFTNRNTEQQEEDSRRRIEAVSNYTWEHVTNIYKRLWKI